MKLYDQFKHSVYQQARSEGYSEDESRRMSALAVISRLERTAGVLVAEAGAFDTDYHVELRFDPSSISVDEAGDGTIVVEGALLTSGYTPVFKGQGGGWYWADEALQSVSDYINQNGLVGALDLSEEPHAGFRERGLRDESESVFEWVQSSVKKGQVWLRAKLKKGFEWVAKRFKGFSIEAKIPAKDGVKAGKIVKAVPHGVLLTNRPKRAENRIYKAYTG